MRDRMKKGDFRAEDDLKYKLSNVLHQQPMRMEGEWLVKRYNRAADGSI